jgi:hypothetical protein
VWPPLCLDCLAYEDFFFPLDRLDVLDFFARFAGALEVVDFFFGTFAPFLRASERPIAIACLRLLTFAPLPLFSVPDFLLFIALLTVLCAFLEYLAMWIVD